MNEVATFIIGGQEVKLGPLPIWSLRRCWSAIISLANPQPDMFDRSLSHCEIIAAGLALSDETVTAESLYRRLLWNEATALPEGLRILLNISGFVAASGNLTQGEPQATTPLMETGMGSSPNLQPTELRVEAGTA